MHNCQIQPHCDKSLNIFDTLSDNSRQQISMLSANGSLIANNESALAAEKKHKAVGKLMQDKKNMHKAFLHARKDYKEIEEMKAKEEIYRIKEEYNSPKPMKSPHISKAHSTN